MNHSQKHNVPDVTQSANAFSEMNRGKKKSNEISHSKF